MVIEAKKADSRKQMDKECEEALKQIVENEYAADLQGEFGEVICYGVAFFRKSAMLKKL